MADYLELVNGVPTEKETDAAFTGDADQIVSTNGDGFVDASLIDPSAIGGVSLITDTGLTEGDFIRLAENAGAPRAERASDNAVGNAAQGFVAADVAALGTASIRFSGVCPQDVAGAEINDRIYLGVNGKATATAPADGAAVISQFLGRYLGDGVGILVDARDPIVLSAS